MSAISTSSLNFCRYGSVGAVWPCHIASIPEWTTLLPCGAELRLLIRSRIRLAFELQKIKNAEIRTVTSRHAEKHIKNKKTKTMQYSRLEESFLFVLGFRVWRVYPACFCGLDVHAEVFWFMADVCPHERHNSRFCNNVLNTNCKLPYARELSLSDELLERCYINAF